jgi:polyisoprenoid-binding protein YceI
MTTTTKLSELTGDYVLDTAHTRIGFVARAMATKVRGQFDEFEGSAHLDGDDPSKSSTELTIQAKCIQTRNQQRDEHLRSKFLDMDKTTRPSPAPRSGWSRSTRPTSRSPVT